jgi:hypothetical protein
MDVEDQISFAGNLLGVEERLSSGLRAALFRGCLAEDEAPYLAP